MEHHASLPFLISPMESHLLSRFLLAAIEAFLPPAERHFTAVYAAVLGSPPPSSSPLDSPHDVLPHARSLLARASPERCHRLQPHCAAAFALDAGDTCVSHRCQGEHDLPRLLSSLVPSPPVAAPPFNNNAWFPCAARPRGATSRHLAATWRHLNCPSPGGYPISTPMSFSLFL